LLAASTDSGMAGWLDVELDFSASFDPDAAVGESGIAVYRLDLDGNGVDDIVTASPEPVTYSFHTEGEHTVLLTVVDGQGLEHSTSTAVTLSGVSQTIEAFPGFEFGGMAA